MRRFEKVKNFENSDFSLPKRSTKHSAGYDFYCPEKIIIPSYHIGDDPVMVRTGVKAQIPEDEFLMLVNRSSNPKKKKLVIPMGMGIIDADYFNNPDNEGEMFFAFYNLSGQDVVINEKEKLGQRNIFKILYDRRR